MALVMSQENLNELILTSVSVYSILTAGFVYLRVNSNVLPDRSLQQLQTVLRLYRRGVWTVNTNSKHESFRLLLCRTSIRSQPQLSTAFPVIGVFRGKPGPQQTT